MILRNEENRRRNKKYVIIKIYKNVGLNYISAFHSGSFQASFNPLEQLYSTNTDYVR